MGWATAVPLAVLAFARVAGFDSDYRYVQLVAGTFYLFLPAYVVLGFAAVTRRRWLAGVALLLVVAHLSWATAGSSLLQPPGTGVAAAATPVTPIRVFTANLLFANPDTGGIAAEIRAARPDVVLLLEQTPENSAGLYRNGVLARYPHRVLALDHGPGGAALYSRFPLEDAAVVPTAGWPVVRGTLRVGVARVRFYGVHPVAPVSAVETARWAAELAELTTVLAAELHPLIVAGDFNATRDHAQFRDLLGSAGLTDAADQTGARSLMTWPNGSRLLPPLVRIDHVLVSSELRATAVRTGTGRGSNHRPVIADLVLHHG